MLYTRAHLAVITPLVAALALAASTLGGCEDGPQARPIVAPQTAPLALTPAEYNNTIADLLGMPRDAAKWPDPPPVAARISPPRALLGGIFGAAREPVPPYPWRFPAEPGADGFDGIAQGQSPSAYQIEELNKAALHFAAYALVSPTFFDCARWTKLADAQQKDCAWRSLERFAQRAYRRPITSEERARLEAFWRRNEAAGPRDEAVALTVAGVLQAPAFVYRIERGDRATASKTTALLTAWELATRLSYFLWDSMPDPALFAAAQAGELSSRAGVEKQARRMLEDPRARAAVVRFHHQLLGSDNVLLVTPARRAFGPLFGVSAKTALDTTDDGAWPAVLGPLRASMLYETELFVEKTIFEGAGTLTALLTDNHGYRSAATRPIYGDRAMRLANLPTVRRDVSFIALSLRSSAQLTLEPVEFPRDQRAGLLTLPAVLALGAYAVQPGPILRGKLILERLACIDLGTPTAGAQASLPPDTLDAQSTNRQRTEAATSQAPCSSCHARINPPGFAFEHYDALGRYRTEDNGQPVDASGALRLSGGETLFFSDGIELASQLAASMTVRNCYALRWARAALGNNIDEDTPGLEPLLARFREDDSVKELLVSIATSELFRNTAVTR